VLNKKRSGSTGEKEQKEGQSIIIGEHSMIKGVVMFLGSTESINYNPQILIQEGTTIHGEVYCSQNLELRGAVFGSVFTNNFVASQNGSIYQNHIYNGTIIVDELPTEYVGLVFEDSKKGVLKWLY